MTKIIGLTGGIGSGKSTVANYIARKGIPVYIADFEAKKIMDSKVVVDEIIAEFGSEISTADEKINRKKLAAIVFSNPDKLKKLNAIIHPKVKLHFKKWLKKHKNHPFIVKEVAILFETKGNLECDKVILVTAPEEVRIKRVIKRDDITENEVRERIKNQISEEEKIRQSDYIIYNINLKNTFNQVDELLKKIIYSQ